MALAHAMNHRNRSDSQDNDICCRDAIEMESMASGSVTSFVRKLFQMVQAECDSVVGFVADGTAFEVKDPRRLEQDILPKYFRHSRFQSLVRQLNFYSFKKISKERSVWIYRHAYFRRDEPELLHALKRKTNQSSGHVRIVGGGMVMDNDAEDLTLERARQARIVKSVSRVTHNTFDTAKPRLRTLSVPRHHPNPTSSSPFYHSSSSSIRHSRPQPTQQIISARPDDANFYRSSNSRSAGGGPSSGGIGGAAAPCHNNQSASSRGPGYGWAGAGGHPVRAGGSTGGAVEYRDGGMISGSSRIDNNHQHRNSSSFSRGVSSHTHRWRESVLSDDTSTTSKKPDSGAAGANPLDHEQAMGLRGLSALCQVASATEATTTRCDGGVSRLRDDDMLKNLPIKARRLEGGEECQSKRPCTAGYRRGWGLSDNGNSLKNVSSDYDEGEEDDITSAERDESVGSYRSRSDSASSVHCSLRESPSRVSAGPGISAFGHGDQSYNVKEENERERPREHGGGLTVDRSRTGDRPVTSSGGVFCPSWDWGKAANAPAIRLSGCFIDRRTLEVDQASDTDGDRDRVEMMTDCEEEDDEDEESIRTEEEDVDEDEDGTKGVQQTAGVEETRVTIAPQSRDLEADTKEEAAVGLEGIGALFAQLCSKPNSGTPGDSVYLATVTNSGDNGLREIAVFCASLAGQAPDMAPSDTLASQVSYFLRAEEAVAQDLRVYAEALDPATVDVVGRIIKRQDSSASPASVAVSRARRALDDAKLLRVFCRYAACRLGRAHEVASAVDGVGGADDDPRGQKNKKQHMIAERVTPMLDDCRWKWWRAAVRFS